MEWRLLWRTRVRSSSRFKICVAVLALIAVVATAAPAASSVGNDTVWIEDSLPAGALPAGDPFTWQGVTPAAFSGDLSLQSGLAPDVHQQYFFAASDTLTVQSGDTLVAYVYLDPGNPPRTVMLQWNDGSWEHRAYWGENAIPWGVSDTSSRRYMGALPALGEWVRLTVSAALVDLEGSTVNGMAFTLLDGRASWDHIGKSDDNANPTAIGPTFTPTSTETATPAPAAPTPTLAPRPAAEAVWIEDSLPPGAVAAGDPIVWGSGDPTPVAGSLALHSQLVPGVHQQYFYGASVALTVAVGDELVAFAYLDPAHPPSTLMLQWYDGSWEHRAYWGENNIPWGADGTASRRHMGPLPVVGEWVRMAVPAAQVGLEGSTVTGMAFTLADGQVTWDHIGKASSDGVAKSPTPASIPTTTVTPTPTSIPLGTTPTPSSSSDRVWIEDTLPTGSIPAGDPVEWQSLDPTPYSGTLALRSQLDAGIHQTYFYGATDTLAISSGDALVAHVYLDPVFPPTTLMLQWNDGSWDHRAYWGENGIPWGVDGTASRYYMGPLPSAGAWVRLSVPASAVDLEGRVLSGMAFTLAGGRATWDRIGKTTAGSEPAPSSTPPEAAATPTATSTDTQEPLATQTPTTTSPGPALNTPSPTATPTVPTNTSTATASRTFTITTTPTQTRTFTRTPTGTTTATFTRVPSWTPTPTPTRTPTRTATGTATSTQTPSPTSTRSPTSTATPSRTWTPRPTLTPTYTKTPTRTFPPSRTPTPTVTSTGTPTSTATPTPTCANGIQWDLSSGTVIDTNPGSRVWLTKTVPTDAGWGVFWLRADPDVPQKARLFYAHVDFSGRVTVAPMWLLDVTRLALRDRYYNVAWHDDHYGLLIADQATLYYYNLSFEGVLSDKHAVGPPLFTSTVYDQEADSDIDSYPDGFVSVIEGECSGHSCSYAFRLDAQGNRVSPVYNLVDYDYTHTFYPASAYDGTGFVIIAVKDILITEGGVGTKYFPTDGFGPTTRTKVVPDKEYQWDEFPDIAFDGNHFGSVWTEVTQRVSTSTWQIHFASFRRTPTSSTLIGDRVLDVMRQKSTLKWATQIHAVGGGWVVHYPRWQDNAEPLAVFELLDDRGQAQATMTPYSLSADALGSSVHWLGENSGRMGIARGDNRDGVSTITFETLEPPICRP